METAQEIKAIIRESKREDVLKALHGLPNLPGVTVSRVEGYGRTGTDPGRALEETEMCKLEIVLPPDKLELVLQTILHSARTGQPGDGKIFVYPVSVVINIRQGIRGADAI